MNIEDLKILKQNLESLDENTYVPFCLATGDSSLKIGVCPNYPYKTLDEYSKDQETEDFVKKVEDLIEKSLRQIENSFIPIDSLIISSQNIVLIDVPFAKKYYESNDEESMNRWKEELPKHISAKYVPLNFTLNVGYTGITNEYGRVNGIEDLTDRDLNDIFSTDVIKDGLFGVVDIEKFISMVNALGYNVTYNIFEDGFPKIYEYSKDSFAQKRLLTDDDEYTMSLDVVADFGRVEKLQGKSRY